jgi:hypothetical protein
MEVMINKGGGTDTKHVTQVDTQVDKQIALVDIEKETLFDMSSLTKPKEGLKTLWVQRT